MRAYSSKERIKQMMEYFHINATELCNRTGMNKSTLSYYLSGKREPRQVQLSMLADPFGVDPAWLMGYDIPMFRTDDKDLEEMLNVVSKSDDMKSLGILSDDEINIIKKYRAVDDVSKEMVMRILNIK